MENNELRHWGVKGMRWGVRRFQNKDGTLTKAGQKRYAKEMEKLKAEQKVLNNRKRTQAKIDKLDALRKSVEEQRQEYGSKKEVAKTQPKQKPSSQKKRTIKDLSDDELRERINRIELERDYKDLFKDEQKVKEGAVFTKKYFKESTRKILLDTSVDVAAQFAKFLLVQGANKLGKKLTDGEITDATHTNNKKKS